MSATVPTYAPWLTQVKLDAARTDFPTLTGKGVTVAVIDTGIDYLHPALGGGIGSNNKVITGYDFVDSDTTPMPLDGEDSHGTGTAGMLAADPTVDPTNNWTMEGVAPDVHVIALRTDLGSSDVSSAINWVLQHAKQYNIVAVNINASNPKDLGKGLRALRRANIFVGAPSGNEGKQHTPVYDWGNGVVMTGATTRLGTVANYTQVGPGLDMLAPGSTVQVPWYVWGNHVWLPSDGTSWASPMVVGTAALIKQVNPDFTPAQILSILQQTGTPVQYAGKHTPIYPLLNVDAALKLAEKLAKPMRVARRAAAAKAKAHAAEVKSAPPPVFATQPITAASGDEQHLVLKTRADILS